MVVKESFQYCHFGIRAHVPSSRPVLTFLGAFPFPNLSSSSLFHSLAYFEFISCHFQHLHANHPRSEARRGPTAVVRRVTSAKLSVRGTWTALSRPKLGFRRERKASGQRCLAALTYVVLSRISTRSPK